MADAKTKVEHILDQDRIPTWPPMKKAIWDAVIAEKLNDGHYINAYALTDKLYAAALSAAPQPADVPHDVVRAEPVAWQWRTRDWGGKADGTARWSSWQFGRLPSTGRPVHEDREERPLYAAPQPTDVAEYVYTVPDHCDRIVWRGTYHYLPLATPAPSTSTEEALRAENAHADLIKRLLDHAASDDGASPYCADGDLLHEAAAVLSALSR